MSDNPKMIRVELEYSDGSVVRLTGAEATRWYHACAEEATFCQTRGLKFPVFQWEMVREKSNGG